MVCPFQAWLPKVDFVAGWLVAIFAGRDMTFRTVVMAGSAIIPHLGHSGVQSVVERNRLIEVCDLIKDHGIRRFGQRMFRLFGTVGDLEGRAGLQTHIFRCRIFAGVAIQTIRRLRMSYRGCRCRLSRDNRADKRDGNSEPVCDLN
jgi:hypothetical protein